MKNVRMINNYLFIALGFSFPISIAVSNALIALIVLLWTIERDFKKKFQVIIANKLFIAIVLFLSIHVISLLWSADPSYGWRLIQKYYILLLFPVFLTTIDSKYVDKAIVSFILAMTISEIASYGIYFGFWRGIVGDHYATAFISHVVYTPMLVFTVFLLFNQLVYEKVKRYKSLIYSTFIITMSFNIFISGGRAGQIVFLGLLFLSAILYFRKNLKIFLSVIAMIPLLFILMYVGNDSFRDRTNMTFNSLKDVKKNTSLGQRYNFTRNSLEIIANNPILGVGTGGLKKAYIPVNEKNSPNLPITGQPHNQYIYATVEHGVIGLSLLLFIFYTMYAYSKNAEIDKMSKMRYIFIAFYLIIMFSDIYLFVYATQVLFVYFAVLLYRAFDTNPFVLEAKG